MGLQQSCSVDVAVIPVAGFGTRMLPASKAVPKEMLPVFDKPIIQRVVEEAARAGIRHIIFVTLPGKAAIENHFDANPELERHLQQQGKSDLLHAVQGVLPKGVGFSYVRQGGVFGLGHAIYSARNVVGDRPFAVLLPDVLVDSVGDRDDLAFMVERHAYSGASQVMVERVALERVSDYGIVALHDNSAIGESMSIAGIIEKPSPEESPSQFAVVGRYVFSPSIFQALASLSPGYGGEIQLTDGIARELLQRPVQACVVKGRTFDCGNRLGWLEANFYFAARDAHYGEKVRSLLMAHKEAVDEN